MTKHFNVQKSEEMSTEDIALLKYIASVENISVEYFDGGKSYAIPVATFLFDDSPQTLEELDDTEMVFVDCSYKMHLNMPFLQCEITYGDSETLLESASIPLDEKRRNKHQRELMSLINFCSKRIINQEMSRTKYAISSALGSLAANKQYN